MAAGQPAGLHGLVLDQTELVPPILAAEATELTPDIPPLGAFKTFQVLVRSVADITRLTMPDLLAADVLQPAGAGAEDRRDTWIPLTTEADIRLSRTPTARPTLGRQLNSLHQPAQPDIQVVGN